MTYKLLVIDDDASVHHFVQRVLRDLPVAVHAANNPDEGLSVAQSLAPDVVLLDVEMPRMSGLEAFQRLRDIDRHTPVIFITAGSRSSVAIEAMQLGAFDFIAKPLDVQSLTDVVKRALETRRLSSVPVALSVQDVERFEGTGDLFVGRSPRMLEVFKEIGRVSRQNVTVLIRGESGTGKELVARAIYQFSDRRDRPFMAVNCAALSDTLLESELFGHEKGSFTGADRRHIGKFEQCHGGTFFLDEVGDMSPLTQGKVLRLLQEQRFERVGGNTTIETDVRLIAATNRPLEEMVESGSFRSDLFYRLNVVTIELPPLRERADDIPTLLQYYVSKFRVELNKPDIQGISPDALELLQGYSWPGNVRELQSVVRQFMLKATTPVIVPEYLPAHIMEQGLHPQAASQPAIETDESSSIFDHDDTPHHVSDSALMHSSMPDIDLKRFIEERLAAGTENLNAECTTVMERYLFARVLEVFGGNQSKAAKALGITRGKVRDRIAAFRIVVGKSVTVSSEPTNGILAGYPTTHHD